jgi:hypothetical protein
MYLEKIGLDLKGEEELGMQLGSESNIRTKFGYR